jgi:hypothetical protein
MQNMQKRQKEKEKKDQKRVALGLDIITYGVATTISSHLPMDWIPSQQVTAYSVQHQCKYKKLKIKKKKKIKKKTTAQSIPMWSPTIVLTLPSTV